MDEFIATSIVYLTGKQSSLRNESKATNGRRFFFALLHLYGQTFGFLVESVLLDGHRRFDVIVEIILDSRDELGCEETVPRSTQVISYAFIRLRQPHSQLVISLHACLRLYGWCRVFRATSRNLR